MINRDTFAKILEKYLEKNNITVSSLAKMITEAGVKTSYQQAYRWKRGQSLPNAIQFIGMCKALNINNISNVFTEAYLIEAKRDKYLTKVINYGENRITDRQLPIILQKASAGYGQYIDEADMEMHYVREDVPLSADFGIHVSGDSMEPEYRDGQLVWVEKKDYLNSGEVGVFYLDGNIYIKRLQYDNEKASLISLNKEYKPMDISENSVFTVWGKVLGN